MKEKDLEKVESPDNATPCFAPPPGFTGQAWTSDARLEEYQRLLLAQLVLKVCTTIVLPSRDGFPVIPQQLGK